MMKVPVSLSQTACGKNRLTIILASETSSQQRVLATNESEPIEILSSDDDEEGDGSDDEEDEDAEASDDEEQDELENDDERPEEYSTSTGHQLVSDEEDEEEEEEQIESPLPTPSAHVRFDDDDDRVDDTALESEVQQEHASESRRTEISLSVSPISADQDLLPKDEPQVNDSEEQILSNPFIETPGFELGNPIESASAVQDSDEPMVLVEEVSTTEIEIDVPADINGEPEVEEPVTPGLNLPLATPAVELPLESMFSASDDLTLDAIIRAVNDSAEPSPQTTSNEERTPNEVQPAVTLDLEMEATQEDKEPIAQEEGMEVEPETIVTTEITTTVTEEQQQAEDEDVTQTHQSDFPLPDPRAPPPDTPFQTPLDTRDLTPHPQETPSMIVQAPEAVPESSGPGAPLDTSSTTIATEITSGQVSEFPLPDPMAPPPDAVFPTPIDPHDLTPHPQETPSMIVQAPEAVPENADSGAPLDTSLTTIETDISVGQSDAFPLPDPRAPPPDAVFETPLDPHTMEPHPQETPSMIVQAPEAIPENVDSSAPLDTSLTTIETDVMFPETAEETSLQGVSPTNSIVEPETAVQDQQEPDSLDALLERPIPPVLNRSESLWQVQEVEDIVEIDDEEPGEQDAEAVADEEEGEEEEGSDTDEERDVSVAGSPSPVIVVAQEADDADNEEVGIEDEPTAPPIGDVSMVDDDEAEENESPEPPTPASVATNCDAGLAPEFIPFEDVVAETDPSTPEEETGQTTPEPSPAAGDDEMEGPDPEVEITLTEDTPMERAEPIYELAPVAGPSSSDIDHPSAVMTPKKTEVNDNDDDYYLAPDLVDMEFRLSPLRHHHGPPTARQTSAPPGSALALESGTRATRHARRSSALPDNFEPPVTRSNCGYRKLSLVEDGMTATVLVPQCTLANKELLARELAEDRGVATPIEDLKAREQPITEATPRLQQGLTSKLHRIIGSIFDEHSRTYLLYANDEGRILEGQSKWVMSPVKPRKSKGLSEAPSETSVKEETKDDTESQGDVGGPSTSKEAAGDQYQEAGGSGHYNLRSHSEFPDKEEREEQPIEVDDDGTQTETGDGEATEHGDDREPTPRPTTTSESAQLSPDQGTKYNLRSKPVDDSTVQTEVDTTVAEGSTPARTRAARSRTARTITPSASVSASIESQPSPMTTRRRTRQSMAAAQDVDATTTPPSKATESVPLSSKAKGKRRAVSQGRSEGVADPNAEDASVGDEIEVAPISTPEPRRSRRRSQKGKDDESKYVPNPDAESQNDDDDDTDIEEKDKDGMSDTTDIIPFNQPPVSSVKKRKIRSSISSQGNTSPWQLDRQDDAAAAAATRASPSAGRTRGAKRRAVESRSEPDVPVAEVVDTEAEGEAETDEGTSESKDTPAPSTQATKRSWGSYLWPFSGSK